MQRRKIILFSLAVMLVAAVVLVFTVHPQRRASPWDAVPARAMTVIEIPDVYSFQKTCFPLPVWQDLESLRMVSGLTDDLRLFNEIAGGDANLKDAYLKNSLLAASCISGNDHFDYLLIFSLGKHAPDMSRFLPALHGVQPQVTSRRFLHETIYDFTYADTGKKITMAEAHGVFLCSASSPAVEDALRSLSSGHSLVRDRNFQAVYDNSRPAQWCKVYCNPTQLAVFASMSADRQAYRDVLEAGRFSGWMRLDPVISNQGVTFAGAASAAIDTLPAFLSALHGTQLPLTDASAYAPANTALLFHVHSDHLAEDFISGLPAEDPARSAFMDTWQGWMGTDWAYGIGETYGGSPRVNSFILLSCSDTSSASASLAKLAVPEEEGISYPGMHVLASSAILRTLTHLALRDSLWYSVLPSCIAFAPEAGTLKRIRDAMQKKETLKNNASYAALTATLSPDFNCALYFDLPRSLNLVQSLLSDSAASAFSGKFASLAKCAPLCIRFTSGEKTSAVQGAFSYSAETSKETGTLWETDLDHSVAGGPWILRQTDGGVPLFLVQDTLNILYAITGDGRISWQRPLAGAVMGDMHPVDFYGDGKAEMLFNTQTGINLLDANGNNVGGFPIILTSAANAPLGIVSLLSGDYAFFVPCMNGNVYGFYKEGKPITGWNPMEDCGAVHIPVAGIRSENEQLFAVTNAQGTLFLKSNDGKNAHKPVHLPAPLSGPWYTDASGHALLGWDTRGDRITVHGDGSTDIAKPEQGFVSGTYADLLGNDSASILMIAGNTLVAETQDGKTLYSVLCASDSARIQTCTTDDKVRVAIEQNNTISLLDDNGKTADGFPLPGRGEFLLVKIPGLQGRIVITTLDNRVLAYRIPQQ